MSFDNIRNNTARCQKIVNAEENFAKDVALGAEAPMYMFYTPNLDNDAHNTNISFAAKDVQYLVDTMLLNDEFMRNTMILITFDENSKQFDRLIKFVAWQLQITGRILMRYRHLH